MTPTNEARRFAYDRGTSTIRTDLHLPFGEQTIVAQVGAQMRFTDPFHPQSHIDGEALVAAYNARRAETGEWAAARKEWHHAIRQEGDRALADWAAGWGPSLLTAAATPTPEPVNQCNCGLPKHGAGDHHELCAFKPVDLGTDAEREEYMTVTLSKDGTVTSHHAFDADWDEMVKATETIVAALQERLVGKGYCPFARIDATPPSSVDATIERIRDVLDTERYKIAIALQGIKRAIDGRRWLSEPGRGSYTYDDERYQTEFGAALDEIATALEPLRKIAGDWSDCPRDPLRVAANRSAALSSTTQDGETE